MPKCAVFMVLLLSFSASASQTPSIGSQSSSVHNDSVIILVLLSVLLIFCLGLIGYIVWLKYREKDRQYESIKFSSNPILVTNNDSVIRYANDVALGLLNMSQIELRTKSIFALIPNLPSCLLKNLSFKDNADSQVCLCQKFSKNSQQFLLVLPDDKTIPVSVRALRQKNGDFIYFLTELSVQKNLEEQLEIQNKVATFGEFLAGVLHEVGNPMAAIEGIANELQWQIEHNSGELSFDYMKEQLATIQVQAQRVNEVKNEFSLISNDSHQDITTMSLIDSRSLLVQLVDLAKFDKRSRYIDISLQCADDLPAILSHQGKLTQILLNIISNAIDALQKIPNANIKLTATFHNNTVKISIQDNGPGIPQALLDKVFEAFYTTKAKGTGLGLVICKRLANSLNIDFKINSEQNNGTLVELNVPINDGE